MPKLEHCSFNPSIGLTSVPTIRMLVSLSLIYRVSIPQSGLQAFRPAIMKVSFACVRCFNPSIGLTSVPTAWRYKQHTTKTSCFNPSIGLTSVPTYDYTNVHVYTGLVSIPQSGLQAFRPSDCRPGGDRRARFQSLNRAYKRSDGCEWHDNNACRATHTRRNACKPD